MRRGLRRSTLIAATLGACALAGCSTEPDYQYLEVPDGQTFAKIPADWTLDFEGWVDFMLADASQTVPLPGDVPIAWRAAFNGQSDGEVPRGEINVQFVDPSLRDTLLIGSLIEPVDGVEELSRTKVRVGDLTGWRAVQQKDHDGTMWTTEHTILIDDRRSTTYYIAIQCSDECFERNREEIDEVMTTLRVES